MAGVTRQSYTCGIAGTWKKAHRTVWEMGGKEAGRHVREGVDEKKVTDGEDMLSKLVDKETYIILTLRPQDSVSHFY